MTANSSSSTTTEQPQTIEWTEQSVVSGNPDLGGIVSDVLRLQRQLLFKPTDPEKKHGFLISAFSQTELAGLLEDNGELLLLRAKQRLIGYALLTPIHEFTSLFKPGARGTFEPTLPLNYLPLRYFYQIAVDPEFMGQGVGNRLMATCKKKSPGGLLADILVEPVGNGSSIAFFERCGFAPCGMLSLASYRDFGELKSKVFLWTPSPT